jgi:hypothetical protein
MDLLASLATTALGALIGVGSTQLVERTRAKAAREERDVTVKRNVYSEYLAALWTGRNGLRRAARDASVPEAERSRLAADAFRESKIYELRYQVAIAAPQTVVDASKQAFVALRDLRNAIEAGALHTDAEYLSLSGVWDGRAMHLMTAMREDLGTLA